MWNVVLMPSFPLLVYSGQIQNKRRAYQHDFWFNKTKFWKQRKKKAAQTNESKTIATEKKKSQTCSHWFRFSWMASYLSKMHICTSLVAELCAQFFFFFFVISMFYCLFFFSSFYGSVDQLDLLTPFRYCIPFPFDLKTGSISNFSYKRSWVKYHLCYITIYI